MVLVRPTNSEPDLPNTLFETAKLFWRYFSVAWLFPLVFVFGGIELDELGYPLLFFFAAIPLLFWSFLRASRPWMEQRVQFWHSTFWGIVVPLLIWIGAVLSRLDEIALLAGTYGT
jgi:hypothetical protein